MTFIDVSNTGDYQRTPRIDRAEVRLLWHADFWAGPLSGMLTHQGRERWFVRVAESEGEASGWYRRFVVLSLSAEQHAEESRWHDLFRRCVGGHTDYDEDEREIGDVLPRERWAEFYDAYRGRVPGDFSGCEVIGWFES